MSKKMAFFWILFLYAWVGLGMEGSLQSFQQQLDKSEELLNENAEILLEMKIAGAKKSDVPKVKETLHEMNRLENACKSEHKVDSGRKVNLGKAIKTAASGIYLGLKLIRPSDQQLAKATSLAEHAQDVTKLLNGIEAEQKWLSDKERAQYVKLKQKMAEQTKQVKNLLGISDDF